MVIWHASVPRCLAKHAALRVNDQYILCCVHKCGMYSISGCVCFVCVPQAYQGQPLWRGQVAAVAAQEPLRPSTLPHNFLLGTNQAGHVICLDALHILRHSSVSYGTESFNAIYITNLLVGDDEFKYY